MLTDRQIRNIGRKILLYGPLPGAAGIPTAARLRIAGYSEANRSGKSEGNIGYDLCTFALGVHPHRKTPTYPDCPENAIIWAAADAWPLVGKLLWKEKIRDYLPACQIDDIVWHNRQEEIPQEIRLVNGNVIEFKAYEQRRKAFEGRQIDGLLRRRTVQKRFLRNMDRDTGPAAR